MIKIQIIGYCGKDAVVHPHGTEAVINFSVCHTDKYTDASGQRYEKATWVTCSWWRENTNVAQYIKKGTLVFVEGVPEAKQFKDKRTGEATPFLNMRVTRVELLGGRRDEVQPQQQHHMQQPQQTQPDGSGYKPLNDEDLPF